MAPRFTFAISGALLEIQTGRVSGAARITRLCRRRPSGRWRPAAVLGLRIAKTNTNPTTPYE